MSAKSQFRPPYREYFTAPDQGVAYLEIPKCACTSFKGAIARLAVDDPPQGWRIHQDFPPALAVPEHKMDRSRFFTFTFVRHPIDRFVSFYRDKVIGWDPAIAPMLEDLGIYHRMPIDELIATLDRLPPEAYEKHVRPQHVFLLSAKGALTVDFIGRLERIETDWSRVSRLAGLELELGHEHRQAKEGLLAISPADYEKMLGLYARDFELLGYELVGLADAAARHGLAASEGAPRRRKPSTITLGVAGVSQKAGVTSGGNGAVVVRPGKMGAKPLVLRFAEIEAQGQDRLACRLTSARGDCPPLAVRLELFDDADRKVASEEKVVEATFDVRWVLDFAPRFGKHRVVLSCRLDSGKQTAAESRVRISPPRLLAGRVSA